MEACICNLIEPGDEMIACVNGVFGMRMREVASRYGATVHSIEQDWGKVISEQQITAALKENPNTKVVGIVHAETSTGAHQPLEAISKIVHDAGALLLVDAVTSLGGTEVQVDQWQIDACYSGTQKCISCPPGLAPVTFSPAALEVMDARSTKVTSWYLDMSMLRQYWGEDRVYHHTAPINMTYALHASLKMIMDEGLPERFARHEQNHRALRAGLEALNLEYIPRFSLPMLNAVHVPDGIDDAAVRKRLLNEFGIEIGAGLGPFKGKAWRIGLMGHSSTKRNVMLVLSALESILATSSNRDSAISAASQAYE